MRRRQQILELVALCALAAGTIWSRPAAAAPASPTAAPRSIPSLTEPAEGLAISQVDQRSGFVTFASTSGQGILLPLPASASAEARARGFVDAYGKAFGIADSAQMQLMSASPADALGLEHVRLQQMHKGVPVRAAEFLVHLNGSRVMAANGHVAADLPDDVFPAIASDTARAEARQMMQKYRPDAAPGARYGDPRLEILNRSLLSDPVSYGSRLAWFVEATGEGLREYIWVDAKSGGVLLSFSQLADAKSRTVYNSNHVPDSLPGTLVRVEGGAATGDADEDNAYDFAGLTYDYYLTNHGRDSFDNAGATIVSSAHFCPAGSCPSYANAFWDGTQMVYGDGYASADDVVAHELTHAVTERSANLLYYVQSGALNESYSDIFGESVDLSDSVGNDTAGVRWLLGEDLSIGAIRNMMTPTDYSDPGKMSDSAYFKCSTQAWTNQAADSGGVHSNSGIPNHAYALMVDGGTYNSRTITGIGLTKAGKIEYRALTTYLTSGSGFLDNYNALIQSCTDLVGTAGITAGDCTEVTTALQAVEMNATWACSGATPAPALCPTGVPSYASLEGFESGVGNWTATTTGAGLWDRTTGFAKDGTQSEYGTDVSSTSDHKLSMTSDVVIPAGGRFYFDHAFEFENSGSNYYDAGVLEYSTDGGSVWTDAASLIDAGQGYGGTANASNPLGARQAFVKSSFGYTGTRLNLTSLAGQSVKFRFRVGTDSSVGSLGWLVDNVAIYSCSSGGAPFTDDPLVAGVTPIKKIHITEIQTRIDAVRTGHGLGGYAWRSLTAGTSLILAQDIIDLRAALDEAYDHFAPPRTHYSYTRTIAAGQTILAADIQETRAALSAVE